MLIPETGLNPQVSDAIERGREELIRGSKDLMDACKATWKARHDNFSARRYGELKKRVKCEAYKTAHLIPPRLTLMNSANVAELRTIIGLETRQVRNNAIYE